MKLLRKELAAIRAAVMFFTRLPVPSVANFDPQDLQRAAAWFPYVGWLVGLLAALVWWAAVQWWPPTIASGLSLAATLLLTGAFHEDGLADVCDGLGGGYTKERVLEIMTDSRVGAFGAIGVVMVMALKWQAVACLPICVGAVVLVAGHAISRSAAVALMAVLPYVRGEPSKAKPMATQLTGGRLMVALAGGLLPLLLASVVMKIQLAALTTGLAAVVILWMILGLWFRRRLGGYTGDCLGAAQQFTELGFYLAMAVWR